ncbi:hypothetical protein ASE82_11590 [Sphingomonas sp. Leaf230]|nr:hypothetical protein ASE82_11590 [Sphingomonas sp. Leaf230]
MVTQIVISMSLLTSEALEFEDQSHALRFVVPSIHDIGTALLDPFSGYWIEITDDVFRRPHSKQAVSQRNVVFHVNL